MVDYINRMFYSVRKKGTSFQVYWNIITQTLNLNSSKGFNNLMVDLV